MNLRDYHPKITTLRLLPPYRLPWWEQKINYYVVPCYVWPTYFHDLIHPNLCKCRKIELRWLDIWGYSFKFIPNKRLTVEGLWKIMCEGENESGSLWLTLTLAVTMLFLFLLWPCYLHRPHLFVGYCSMLWVCPGKEIISACLLCWWLWMVRVSHPCHSPDQPKLGL